MGKYSNIILTDDAGKILDSIKHIDITLDAQASILTKEGIFVLDPVMGDHGKLYPAFDLNYVNEMKRLVRVADIVVPNLTEACFLTGSEYKTQYDENYIKDIVIKLKQLGAKKVVLTGVSYKEGMIGIVVYEDDFKYYEHEKIPQNYHGTGDIFSSTLIASYLNSKDLFSASKFAAHFVVDCINKTIGDDNHAYGVKFEEVLKDLITKN
jgi:pyridoxine kinase